MRISSIALAVVALSGCPPFGHGAVAESPHFDTADSASGKMDTGSTDTGSTDTGSTDTGLGPIEATPGVVTGRTCAPAGAYVFIPVDWDGDGVEDGRFEAWTDDDGQYRFEGVPTGAHLVYIADEGGVEQLAVAFQDQGDAQAMASCVFGEPSLALWGGWGM